MSVVAKNLKNLMVIILRSGFINSLLVDDAQPKEEEDDEDLAFGQKEQEPPSNF